MSYILDALKRADAERTRGTVPGLHAQPVATAATVTSAARSRVWWLGAAALALAVIASGVILPRAPADSDRLRAAAPVRAETPAPAPLPAAAPRDAAPVAAQALPNPVGMPIAPAAPPPPTTNPSTRATEETRVVAQVTPTPPSAAPGGGTARKAGLAAPLSPAVAPAPAKTPEDRSSAPLRSELPENVRREIPPLTITGAVDSANPAQRLLLVNGQILPQGGSPAPEVTILEIRAQSSVFSFRGTSFRVLH